MAEVECGNCEHYLWYKEKDGYDEAYCDFCGKRVAIDNIVCEEFILMTGMYTKRSIPEYCKYYKK